MSQVTQEKRRSSETEAAHEMTDAQLKAAQEAGQTALDGVKDEDIDQILADIDDVLEVNAEDFVMNFVQRGGQ